MEENPAAAAGNPKLSNDDQTTSENPKAKRVYNTKGFKKRKAIGRHKFSGKKKQSSHNWAASREVIGDTNANAQQIAAALTPAQPTRPSQRSPSKATVKRQRNAYKGECNKLKFHFRKRGSKIKKLEAEKKGLLVWLSQEKKASREYTDSIIKDADIKLKLTNNKLNEALNNKRYVYLLNFLSLLIFFLLFFYNFFPGDLPVHLPAYQDLPTTLFHRIIFYSLII